MAKYGMGWTPSLPDYRDKQYSVSPSILASLPPSVDLTAGMGPVLNQGSLGCHDDRTEVLTDQGWRSWASYVYEDSQTALLGTMNPLTHALEFQAPTALHAYDYAGPLVYADHKRLDFALTPNHRMYVRKWNERERTLRDDYSIVEAGKIGWYAGLPNAPSGFAGVELKRLTLGRREMSGDDFLALVALVVSDGWAGGAESTWDRVSFCCFRDDRRAMVAGLAARLGVCELPGRPGVWELSDVEMAGWFRANAYTGNIYRSPFKRVPDIVKTVCSRQVGHFLRFFGDQHTAASGGRQFYSSSARMIDDLQELLLRIGVRSSIYSRPQRDAVLKDGRHIDAGDNPDITLTEATKSKLSLERKTDIAYENYRGQVFCATVPNGLLVTRRNGSILISGNSCGPNSLASMIMWNQQQQGQTQTYLSRLFLYYNARMLMGTVESDSGVNNRDMMRAYNKWGECDEVLCPYSDDKVTFRKQPSQAAYQAALPNRVLDYQAVPQTGVAMKGCLASGDPFLFGFVVYENFMDPDVERTGIVPMPRGKRIGGHDVVMVGYSEQTRLCKFKNSWGDRWGDKGYGYFSPEYCLSGNLSSDFWVVKTIPGGVIPPTPPTPPTPVTGKTTISFPDGTIAEIPPGAWKAELDGPHTIP